MNSKTEISYPLNKSHPKKLIVKLAISPLMFMMGAMWILYTANNNQQFLAKEVGAMGHYALIVMLGSLIGTLFNPIMGKLGDLFGRKRVALVLSAIYIAGAFCAAAAKNTIMFAIGVITISTLQTILIALTHGLLIDVFDGSVRPTYMSLCDAVSSASSMIAPALMGLISDNISVRLSFAVSTVILIIAWIYMLVVYPDIRNIKKDIKIDWVGLITMWLCVAPICVALSTGGKQIPWSSPAIWIMLVVGIIFFFVFVSVEKKQVQPLVDLKMFKIKGFGSVMAFASLQNVLARAWTYFTVYLQVVCGYNATKIGTLSFLLIISIILSPMIGAYLSKTQNYKRVLMISAIFGVLGGVLYSFTINPNTPFFVAMLCKLSQGLAVAFAQAPLFAYIGEFIPAERRGIALALRQFFSNLISSTLLLAVCALLINNTGGTDNIVNSFKYIGYMMLALSAVRVIITLKLPSIKDMKASVAEVFGHQ